MDTNMVTVDASAMAKGIASDGHVALYGILFDTDKTDIKPESAATIAEIAKFLKQDASVKLYVVGHTDNVGLYDYNMGLSQRRAAAVVAELTTKHGIRSGAAEASRIGPAVAGRAERQPKTAARRTAASNWSSSSPPPPGPLGGPVARSQASRAVTFTLRPPTVLCRSVPTVTTTTRSLAAVLVIGLSIVGGQTQRVRAEHADGNEVRPIGVGATPTAGLGFASGEAARDAREAAPRPRAAARGGRDARRAAAAVRGQQRTVRCRDEVRGARPRLRAVADRRRAPCSRCATPRIARRSSACRWSAAARRASITPIDRAARASIHHYRGNDPRRWRTNVRAYCARPLHAASTTASTSSTTAISSGSNTTSRSRRDAIPTRSVSASTAPRAWRSTRRPATCCSHLTGGAPDGAAAPAQADHLSARSTARAARSRAATSFTPTAPSASSIGAYDRTRAADDRSDPALFDAGSAATAKSRSTTSRWIPPATSTSRAARRTTRLPDDARRVSDDQAGQHRRVRLEVQSAGLGADLLDVPRRHAGREQPQPRAADASRSTPPATPTSPERPAPPTSRRRGNAADPTYAAAWRIRPTRSM